MGIKKGADEYRALRPPTLAPFPAWGNSAGAARTIELRPQI